MTYNCVSIKDDVVSIIALNLKYAINVTKIKLVLYEHHKLFLFNTEIKNTL